MKEGIAGGTRGGRIFISDCLNRRLVARSRACRFKEETSLPLPSRKSLKCLMALGATSTSRVSDNGDIAALAIYKKIKNQLYPKHSFNHLLHRGVCTSKHCAPTRRFRKSNTSEGSPPAKKSDLLKA